MFGPSGPSAQSVISSTKGTLTDYSGQIVTASVAVNPLPANSNRIYLLVQNTSSDDLYINFTTTATTGSPSVLLKAGEGFVFEQDFITTESVSVIGATAGQTFTIKEG